MDGRLDVQILGPDGRGIPARVELSSRSPEFVAAIEANPEGRAVLRRLPLGSFLLTASRTGFETLTQRLELRSAVPQAIELVLQIAQVKDEITVRSSLPLFEPFRPSQPVRVGRESLDRSLGTTLGRSTVDVLTTIPGWLLEANAVLHPRGSEYDTQYVVDGVPLYDNRSIAYAPSFQNSEFEAVSVLTAGIPAEYGRRLGGVIALDTVRAGVLRQRSTADLQVGSYGNRIGSFSHQHARQHTELSFGVQAGMTDRYLDPPSLENFTNNASLGGGHLRFDADLSPRDRLATTARLNRTAFLVPNDLNQQAAGQRQDRRTREGSGQIHYHRTVSSRSLLSMQGMFRDLKGELWSNNLATPVYVLQDRDVQEGALLASLTYEGEAHTFKVGGDFRRNAIREQFAMAEQGRLPEFDLEFADQRSSTEASAYVQDAFRVGAFAASAGVRLDSYRLLITDSALSPRLAASYFVPRAAFQFYASYDRIFQPPPNENLLLSSAATGFDVDDVEGSLPLPASRAHFFEIGLRRPFGDSLRLDVKHYWRTFRNAIDDDVFLNTGISFPITFESAEIEGTEVRLEMPHWRGISSVVSYSNMLGRTSSPVTGGLFIEGSEAQELRDVSEEFPLTQDQRNTVYAMARFEVHPRLWVSAGLRYGSGLPVELEDDGDDSGGAGEPRDDMPAGDADNAPEQLIPRAILNQVNFERGRVRSNFSLDFSVEARIWKQRRRTGTLQFDLRNASNRLNVINFSGLFSGTALAPGRQATLQLRFRF